jgi:hypothetical protein
MEKIPTAKNFLQNLIEENNHDSNIDIEDALIEFAKLHVEQALKAKVRAMKEYHKYGEYSFSEIDAFTLNSYPLSNIK